MNCSDPFFTRQLRCERGREHRLAKIAKFFSSCLPPMIKLFIHSSHPFILIKNWSTIKTFIPDILTRMSETNAVSLFRLIQIHSWPTHPKKVFVHPFQSKLENVSIPSIYKKAPLYHLSEDNKPHKYVYLNSSLSFDQRW